MPQPLVSICIPTYNGIAFLSEALDSVRSQTYKNFEVVVSDDMSTDGSWELLERFRESVNFPVYLYKHTPSGIGANWNNTIKKAKGKYIKFLFQDDILEDTCVEKMVNFMEAHPSYGLVACKRELLVEGDLNAETKRFVEKYSNLQIQFDFKDVYLTLDKSIFKRDDFFAPPKNKVGEPPTVMFTRKIIAKVGFFDEELKQILDYVFYYRVIKEYPIAILQEKLVKFRVHPNQTTNRNKYLDIQDYSKYDYLIYKEFNHLMNTKSRIRLLKKFHPVFKVLVQLKRIFEKFTGIYLFKNVKK